MNIHPKDSHQILDTTYPNPPPGLIIKWNQTLFTTATKLTEILNEYWVNQKEELDIEFEIQKMELEEKSPYHQTDCWNSQRY